MKYSPTIAIMLSKLVVDNKRSVYNICQEYSSLDEKELRVWSALYREYGEEVFYSCQEFDVNLRRAIVEDMISHGLSKIRTCVKYRITSRSRLRNWERNFKTGKMGKKKSQTKSARGHSSAEERVAQLELELLYTKAENAYLKKLQALMQQEKKG